MVFAPPPAAAYCAGLSTLSAQYPRYGYRWIRIFLRREGFTMGVNRPDGCGGRRGSACPGSGLGAV